MNLSVINRRICRSEFLKKPVHYSMRTLLLWPLLLLIVSFLIINSLIVYYLAVSQLKKSAVMNITSTVSQTCNFLDSRLSEVQQAFYRLDNHNRSNIDFCSVSPYPDHSYSQYLMNMNTQLNDTYFSHYEMLDSAILYIEKDNTLLYKANLPPTKFSVNTGMWSEYFTDRLVWGILEPQQQVIDIESEDKIKFSLLKIYKSRYQDISTLLQVDIKYNYVSQIINNNKLEDECGLFIVENNKITNFNKAGSALVGNHSLIDYLSNSDNQSSGSFVLKNSGSTNMLIIYDTIPVTGWKIAAFIPEEVLTKRATVIAFMSFLSLFVLLLLSALIVTVVIRLVTQPLAKIVHKIENIGENSLDIDFQVTTLNKEVYYLTRGLSYLVDHSRNLLENVKTQQEQKRQAEFNALLTQINPHFLYNTLYTIKQLCDMNDSKNSGQMVMALSNFYRIGISNGSCEISISQEFMLAESYLEINQIRFGKQLVYELSLPDNLKKYSIIKMTLQPLIENSIKHAFTDFEGQMLITLNAKLIDNDLILTLVDNGSGMSEEKILQLRQTLAELPDYQVMHVHELNRYSIGMGIKNVHDRLRMYYGDKYGLEISSGLEKGTRINVRIPAVILSEKSPY